MSLSESEDPIEMIRQSGADPQVPVAEHLFFRCKLLINPSYLKGLPIGTNRGILAYTKE